MKATGIVRRIEECDIIGQKLKKPHKHWGFADFVQKKSRNQATLCLSFGEARC